MVDLNGNFCDTFLIRTPFYGWRKSCDLFNQHILFVDLNGNLIVFMTRWWYCRKLMNVIMWSWKPRFETLNFVVLGWHEQSSKCNIHYGASYSYY